MRATDPARIAKGLAAASHQTHYPETLRREAYGIASGDAGLAVMCAACDACMPRDGWDVTGHAFITTAALAAERTAYLPPGLFGGLTGLAFAVTSLSREGRRYGRLLATVDTGLAAEVSRLGGRVGGSSEPISVSEFDLISGLSGIGAHLLRRDPHGLLPAVLRALVGLAKPRAGLPRWFTPPELLGDDSARQAYPWGNLNCGLAHGIPAPLAVLALALRAGQQVPGQSEAVRGLADWLAAHRVDDRWGVNWPAAVPVAADGEADLSVATPSRSAWCYGSPGVARALWHAGEALDDDAYRGLAVEGMLATLRRPRAARYIDSPTFCHGVAGLLQVVLRFARDTGHASFVDAAGALVDQLLGAYERERPLGYADLEPGPNPVDRVGLLDGAPGVAMVLLAAATDVEPVWDRLFLLS